MAIVWQSQALTHFLQKELKEDLNALFKRRRGRPGRERTFPQVGLFPDP